MISWILIDTTHRSKRMFEFSVIFKHVKSILKLKSLRVAALRSLWTKWCLGWAIIMGWGTWYLSICTIVRKHHGLIGLHGKGRLSRQDHPCSSKRKVIYYLRLVEITSASIEFSKSLLDTLCVLPIGSNHLSPFPSKEGLVYDSSTVLAMVTSWELEICLPGLSERYSEFDNQYTVLGKAPGTSKALRMKDERVMAFVLEDCSVWWRRKTL